MEHAQLLGTRGAFIHECGELGFPMVGQSTNSKQQPTNPIPGKIKTILFQLHNLIKKNIWMLQNIKSFMEFTVIFEE